MFMDYHMLRSHYIADLRLSETYNGKDHKRVKNIHHWKTIHPFSKDGEFIDIGAEIDNGRKCWFWSDQHFGHHNIISYCARPYGSADEMNSSLIKNYTEKVGANDIVVFGGDIAFMRPEAINPIIESLPGYKILIVGNHDLDRDGKVKDLHVDEYHVCLSFRTKLFDGFSFLLTHYPILNMPAYSFNIHGHIHGKRMPSTRHINISVENTKYSLLSIDDIISIAEHNLNLPGL